MICPKRIIIAEADAEAREMLDMALSTLRGTRVVMLANVQAVLSACEHRCPDLLVLDSALAVDGAARFVQQARLLPGLADVPIVFTAADLSASCHQVLRDAGAVSVLVKPIDPLSVAERLCRLWREAAPAVII